MTQTTPLVYLDSNIFISAYESIGAVSDHACWLMEAAERGEIVVATSELTLAELLVKPVETGDQELAEGYKQMLTTSRVFQVAPVRRDILIESAKLRAQSGGLRLPDAIHLATARALGCSAMVTGDRRMRSPDLSILPLGPFTLDDILGAAP